MKISIRNQLLLAFAATLLLTLIVGWVGISQASVLNDRSSLMYDQDLVSTSHIVELAQLTMQDRATGLEHIMATDAASKAGHQIEINGLDAQVDQALLALKASDSAGLLSAPIQAFEQAWTSYKQARDTLTLPASNAGNTAQALAAATGPVDQRVTALEDSLTALTKASQAAGLQRDLENDATFVQARLVILGVTGGALLLGIVIAFFLARRIAGNLSVVERAARAPGGRRPHPAGRF